MATSIHNLQIIMSDFDKVIAYFVNMEYETCILLPTVHGEAVTTNVFTNKILARAIGVSVGWHSGDLLATMLEYQ